MPKFKTKDLAVVFLCGVLFVGVAGIAGVVSAQTSIQGGDSFDDAVEIESGSYEGEAMENEDEEYFYITGVKPGQEISIEATVEPEGAGEGRIVLYNEDEEELAEDYAVVDDRSEKISISWLSNSDEDSYKYYIMRTCSWVSIASLSFDVSFADYYDGESTTDAGDLFDKALELTSGEYTGTGYLSGEAGTDMKDLYEVGIKSGETLNAKVTTSDEAQLELEIYDSNRESVADEWASTPGAIVEVSYTAEVSGDIFVGVLCDQWCSNEIVEYSLDISGGEAPTGQETGQTTTTTTIGETSKTSKLPLILGVVAAVVIVVLGIIGVVVFILFKSKKGKSGGTEKESVPQQGAGQSSASTGGTVPPS